MAAYFAHVGDFDPKNKDDDINGWLDRFDACVRLNGIAPAIENADDVPPIAGVNDGAVERESERNRRSFLIAEIGPAGFAVLKNKILPPSSPFLTQSYFLRKHLRDYYNPPHSQESALLELDGRLQQPDESVSDFVIAIQRLAFRCGFNAAELQAKLLYKMKTGVRDRHARMKMRTEGLITYDRAVEIARNAEIVAAQDKVIQQKFSDMKTSEEPKSEVQKVSTTLRGRGGQHRAGRPNQPRGRGRGYPQNWGYNPQFQNQGLPFQHQGGRGGFQPRGQRGGFQPRGRGEPSPRGRGAPNPEGQPQSQRGCYTCGSHEHIQRFCPDLCWNCGGRGHRSHQCPSAVPNDNNVSYVHQQDSNDGAYYDDMFQEGSSENCEYLFDDSVGFVMDSEVVSIDKISVDLESCFMDLEEKRDCDSGHENNRLDDNNNQVTECFDSKIMEETMADGVWYDYSENTWKQVGDEDKYIENLNDEGLYDVKENVWKQCGDIGVGENTPLETIGSESVLFELVYQIDSKKNSGESRAVNVTINVNSKRIRMSIDSGSKETLMPMFLFKEIFPTMRLRTSQAVLASVEGENIKVIGECIVEVIDTNGHKHEVTLVVVDSRRLRVPLVGRKWLDKVCPGWRTKLFQLLGDISEECVNYVREQEEELLELRKKFPKVFSGDKKSAIEGFQAEIVLKEGAVPIIAKEYPIPFYMRERVLNKLWEDVNNGKAKIVTKPKWASPIFAIEKPNKDVRIIVDFKRTVNFQVKMDYFPMPNPADLYGSIDAEAQYFVRLDCSDAYKQMKASENSKQYLVANTPIGFLEYQSLLYGLSIAPALFQHMMYVILKGINGVFGFLDDILIWGRTKEECSKRLMEVLSQLESHNVRINEEKCEWFVKSVTYLGFRFDKEGRHILEDRIRPIVEAPAPKDVTQLRSYLGSFNVYKSFLPDTSIMLRPLHELLKMKSVFRWTDECQAAFNLSKQMLVSNKMLVHYNPKLPLVLSTDASPYGISAVLSHRLERVDRPIVCHSSSLDETQQRYSQIEREGLAIVYGVVKNYKYLAGRKFILRTDNLPLKHIFAPDKGIPILAASRLQHWAAILSTYNYDIEYTKSAEMGLADTLSRLPLKDCDVNKANLEVVGAVDSLEETPLNYEIIAYETKKDVLLQKVAEVIHLGWPDKCPHISLEPFFKVRFNLSLDRGCVMFGNRVIIPEILRQRVLDRLHDGHPGIVRSKMLARETFWWPLIDDRIEKSCQSCPACSIVNFRPASNVTVPWPDPGEPWIRVHMDFFDLESNKYFVLVDSFSKWTMLWHMSDKTDAPHVIAKLEEVFTLLGPPEMLVCDNGPPFDSTELALFCTRNQTVLKRVPKYHPQSDGLAERMVQTAKRKLKVFMLSPEAKRLPNVQSRINLFLKTYRNTPTTVTGCTPNQLILSKSPRTPLSVLRPPHQPRELIPDRARFQADDKVLCKFSKKHPVVEGTVVRALGPTVYLVYVEGEVVPISINQLRLKYIPKEEMNVQNAVVQPNKNIVCQNTNVVFQPGLVQRRIVNIPVTPVNTPSPPPNVPLRRSQRCRVQTRRLIAQL